MDFERDMQDLQDELEALEDELLTAPLEFHEDIQNDIDNVKLEIEELEELMEESVYWDEELRFQNLEYERSVG
jgi:SMC interacting uncharacterized protein involved in chromosome segregation